MLAPAVAGCVFVLLPPLRPARGVTLSLFLSLFTQLLAIAAQIHQANAKLPLCISAAIADAMVVLTSRGV